jgi:hypothetical protein
VSDVLFDGPVPCDLVNGHKILLYGDVIGELLSEDAKVEL